MLSTSTDLHALAMVSTQINKDPGPPFDTKPYCVIMQTLGCHIGSDRINILCHSFQPPSLPFPSYPTTSSIPPSLSLTSLLSPSSI